MADLDNMTTNMTQGEARRACRGRTMNDHVWLPKHTAVALNWERSYRLEDERVGGRLIHSFAAVGIDASGAAVRLILRDDELLGIFLRPE